MRVVEMEEVGKEDNVVAIMCGVFWWRRRRCKVVDTVEMLSVDNLA